ncbi:hypothetical protein IWX90DRAFT_415123 [Phyllosticta citrichinensis]|uniref:Uncharacterized protein n=1 Tax=Phyllosticta citrichinensis TaxID=1130410 RepID=A0ABR1XUJ6_9PEZI
MPLVKQAWRPRKNRIPTMVFLFWLAAIDNSMCAGAEGMANSIFSLQSLTNGTDEWQKKVKKDNLGNAEESFHAPEAARKQVDANLAYGPLGSSDQEGQCLVDSEGLLHVEFRVGRLHFDEDSQTASWRRWMMALPSEIPRPKHEGSKDDSSRWRCI